MSIEIPQRARNMEDAESTIVTDNHTAAAAPASASTAVHGRGTSDGHQLHSSADCGHFTARGGG